MSKRYLQIDATSGIAGDMFSAALVDLLLKLHQQQTLADWRKQLIAAAENFAEPFKLEIELEQVNRRGLMGQHLQFKVENARKSVYFEKAKRDIINSVFEQEVKEMALATLTKLAEVEAELHGVALEKVHLHEAGSEDSILDALSAAFLYQHLGKPEVFYSTLAVAGRGKTSFSHGEVPLPVPASAALLQGYTLTFTEEERELITPTGAAIVKNLQAKPMPEGLQATLVASGYGAGSRELASRPNILRINLLEEAHE